MNTATKDRAWGPAIVVALVVIAFSLATCKAERKTPGYSWCEKCERTWDKVSGHVTDFSEYRGIFPLCESCWRELKTPEARLPYYSNVVFKSWRETNTWPAVKAAVLAETNYFRAMSTNASLFDHGFVNTGFVATSNSHIDNSIGYLMSLRGQDAETKNFFMTNTVADTETAFWFEFNSFTIFLSCGNKAVFGLGVTIPTTNVPCPCGRTNHWLWRVGE